MYNLGDWDISDDGRSPDDVLQNGNRLLTGNGYLGRRGVVDEAEPCDMPATILAGIYDRYGDLWREPVNSTDPLYLLITNEELPLRAGDGQTVSHEQALNFRYGIYSRCTSWRLSAGLNNSDSKEVTITARTERYAHMENVHLLCMRYTIRADVQCRLVIKQGINRAVRDLNGPHLGDFRFWKSQCMYALLACETGGSDWAYPFFIKTAEIDITGKSKHFAGLVYIGGTHPAGNGGAWLTAIRGFCGFFVGNGKIKIVPRLPEHWKKVSFSVILRGVKYKITVTKDNFTIE